MKSIVTAALVVALEAGFLFSVAAPAGAPQRAGAELAARPAAAVQAAPALVPCPAESQAAAPAVRPGSGS